MTPLTLALAALVTAGDLSLDETAQITVEQEQARAEVVKKYGSKPNSELSQAERREMTKDLAEAQQKVLDKHGVDAKSFERQALKRSRDEYAQQQATAKKLRDDAKNPKDQPGKKAPKDVTIQRGVSDENPVTVEENEIPEGQVQVERELPPEAASDDAEVKEAERLESMDTGGGDSKPSKPAPKSSHGGGRRR